MQSQAGSTWSVDVEGAQTLLSKVDVSATEMCSAATSITGARDTILSALSGSPDVVGAFSGFFDERESAPGRIASRIARSAGAVMEGVTAIVFGDDEMATRMEPGAGVLLPGVSLAAPGQTVFDSLRFGAQPK